MFSRLATVIVVLVVAAAALLLTWPQLIGLNDQIGIAQVISFRAALVIIAAILAVVCAIAALARRPRRLMGAVLAIVLVFGIGNAAILAERGLKDPSGTTAAASADDDVTVLSWNTRGDGPGARAVAELALERGANVVTLPETTNEMAVEVAKLMKAAGHPMWVHHVSFSSVYKALTTTVLISPDLGDYTVESEAGTGPPGNTNVSPTVVARPIDGDGPTIVAVHAVSPLNHEMRNWRSDLDWLATQCASGGDVIMAGDFNATLDHMAGRGSSGGVLGACADAAKSAGSAGVGTWPTDVPSLLGAPIDHVLATSTWRTTGYAVITDHDGDGSDHRPIVATLTRS